MSPQEDRDPPRFPHYLRIHLFGLLGHLDDDLKKIELSFNALHSVFHGTSPDSMDDMALDEILQSISLVRLDIEEMRERNNKILELRVQDEADAEEVIRKLESGIEES